MNSKEANAGGGSSESPQKVGDGKVEAHIELSETKEKQRKNSINKT